jgi:hypothetical protein
MAITTKLSPDQEISTSDPGDDVQQRFRYQAAYSALLCLKLLDKNSGFEEIYCEHHEDTLVKRTDNTFIGVQVKTRLPSKIPFKSTDEEIISSIVRFVELYITYPKYFYRFVLATNSSFWSEDKDNPNNLRYILTSATKWNGIEHEEDQRHLEKYANKIAKVCNLKCPENIVIPQTVIEVLRIIEIEDGLPKFEDIDLRLSQTIPIFDSSNNEASLEKLLKISRGLITLALEAASLANVSTMRSYFAFSENPNQQRETAIINGKRITASTVREVIKASNMPDVLLKTEKPLSIDSLPTGANLIDIKMTRGGIGYRNVQLTKDYTYSTEYLLDRWLYKLGPEEANKRFDHIKTVVSTECAEAYDETQNNETQYGQAMLTSLRKKLRNRLDKEKHLFFDCEYEHLLGIAGILTGMCDVWWSERFNPTARHQ